MQHSFPVEVKAGYKVMHDPVLLSVENEKLVPFTTTAEFNADRPYLGSNVRIIVLRNLTMLTGGCNLISQLHLRTCAR